MNAASNGAFAPVLRDVEKAMTLPIPERVRILEELQSDLEELMDRLVDEGLPAREARARALEALVPSAETMAELNTLHTPLYRRLTRQVSSRKVMLAERWLLVLATFAVLLTQTGTLFRARLLQDPSPFLVPVLLGGAALFALVLRKAFQFWIKRDHLRPGQGLGAILWSSGGILSLGVGGMVLDLYHVAGILEASQESPAPLVTDWLVRNSIFLSVTIIIALSGGLAWLVLSQWLALVSRSRRELLGLHPPLHLEGEGEHDC